MKKNLKLIVLVSLVTSLTLGLSACSKTENMQGNIAREGIKNTEVVKETGLSPQELAEYETYSFTEIDAYKTTYSIDTDKYAIIRYSTEGVKVPGFISIVPLESLVIENDTIGIDNGGAVTFPTKCTNVTANGRKYHYINNSGYVNQVD